MNKTVHVSVANVYRRCSYKSEMVSQALLGESVEVLGEENEFYKVRQQDGYKGWIKNNQVSDPQVHIAELKTITSHIIQIYREKDENSFQIRDAVIGSKLNVIDTPGYADFVGEVICGIRATDTAVICIDAINGLEVGTETSWELCEKYDIKNIFFFSNGEPTLYWDKFHQIIDITKNFDINYQLTTNGAITNQQVLNDILEYKFSILISIDGMLNIHNFHRPIKKRENSYNQVKSFIDWSINNLDDKNKIFSRTTITKYNINC